MGNIREPKNIDLVVAPSILTEDIKYSIQQAIALYKKTEKKPESVEFVMQGSVKVSTHPIRSKPARTNYGKAKI